MKHFFQHIRVHMFRGLLAVIPILLCCGAVYLLYALIDQRVVGFLSGFFPVRKIPGLGILLVLISLYLIGVVVSNFLGHRLLKVLENITQRIPFINTIYNVGKQVSQGLSVTDGDKQAFKKAVLVRLSKEGLWVPAFVTGGMKNHATGEEFLVVLIPTAPTPASGFVFVVRASETMDPGWSIEECLKAIISVGIITPKERSVNL